MNGVLDTHLLSSLSPEPTSTICSPFHQHLNQSRIQDFAQRWATANRGPKARGPMLPLSKAKNWSIWSTFFSQGLLTFLFSYFCYVILFILLRGGHSPMDPLGYIPDLNMPLLSSSVSAKLLSKKAVNTPYIVTWTSLCSMPLPPPLLSQGM